LAQFINRATGVSFTLPQSNMTENKQTGELYKAVRKDFTLPPAVVEALYNTKYCAHFFTPDENAAYKKLYSSL
jgi:hypothetical protein